jgi:hypothetical protein
VSDAPKFEDLIGGDLPPAERDRLERVHEMLVAAGPPPELPPELANVPDRHGSAMETEPTGLPRRRIGAALALAAAIALVAFVGGYVAGYNRTNDNFQAVRSVVLAKGGQRADVQFGPRDSNGNTPMLVKVQGLRRLPAGDYYTLFMTKNGKPIVLCGSFNVRGEQSTTLHFPVAYDPSNFDGLQLARYRHTDHKNVPLFSSEIAS